MRTINDLLGAIFTVPALKIIFPDHCLWTQETFMQRLAWSNLAVFDKSNIEILSQPLAQLPPSTNAPSATLKLLIEIFFRGKYSNDDYFTIEGDAEPATELLHGLEFATYALQAGAPDEDVVAGMLHDIGRFYYAPDHANRHHHTDGYALLAELFGTQVGEFCLLHGYAKALLYEAVPGYPDGMTSVSMKTLLLQRANFAAVHDYLDQLADRREQQYAVLKAMFFRILDDASKYPLEPQFHLVSEPMVQTLLTTVAANAKRAVLC